MKQLSFIFALLFVGVLSAQNAYEEVVFADTLRNTTPSAYLLPFRFKQLYHASFHVQVDSVSGTGGGQLVLQESNDIAGNRWRTVQTLQVSGATSQAIWSVRLVARRYRLFWNTPTTGTRKRYFVVDGVLKRESN